MITESDVREFVKAVSICDSPKSDASIVILDQFYGKHDRLFYSSRDFSTVLKELDKIKKSAENIFSLKFEVGGDSNFRLDALYRKAKCVKNYFITHDQNKIISLKKQKSLQQVCRAIKNLIYPPRALPLSDELILNIFKYLSFHQLNRVACVNKHAYVLVKEARLQHAETLGYNEDFFGEKLEYLKIEFKRLAVLCREDLFPRRFIRYSASNYRLNVPFLRQPAISLEDTLHSIYSGSSDNTTSFKEALCNYFSSCIFTESIQVLDALLGLGADPNSLNRKGKTPLLRVLTKPDLYKKYRKKLILLLITHGADPNITTLQTNQSTLTKTSDAEVTEWLLEAGANPDYINGYGCTALHYAVHRNQKETVKVLLRYNADPNVSTFQNNRSALSFVKSDPDIAEWLLQAKADPNHQDIIGNTALHYAVKDADNETVRVLLKYGADMTIRNHEGKTPYD